MTYLEKKARRALKTKNLALAKQVVAQARKIAAAKYHIVQEGKGSGLVILEELSDGEYRDWLGEYVELDTWPSEIFEANAQELAQVKEMLEDDGQKNTLDWMRKNLMPTGNILDVVDEGILSEIEYEIALDAWESWGMSEVEGKVNDYISSLTEDEEVDVDVDSLAEQFMIENNDRAFDGFLESKQVTGSWDADIAYEAIEDLISDWVYAAGPL